MAIGLGLIRGNFDILLGTGPTRGVGVCQFGPFEVLARLASGGAASVFLARRPSSSGIPPWHLVCLKTLLDRRSQDEDFIAMFLDEARLGQLLDHPGCVQVEDYGEINGIKFQVMEFIFGMNVWELLGSVPRTKKALPPTSVAQLLARACHGLHFAHELKNQAGDPYKLIHRDISPQNIMLTYDGKVKVLDFGVAKADTGRSATATGIVKGKFAYMSPEQISGGVIDHRSDLYSMGIIMFECLASRRLYKGDTPQEIAKMIIENRPPALSEIVPHIDPQLEKICNQALQFSPNERFDNAQQMADALDEYTNSMIGKDEFVSLKMCLENRFDEEYLLRRQILSAIRKGEDYDERELMEVLNARPVLELDFQPDDGSIGVGDNPVHALRVPFTVADDLKESMTYESSPSPSLEITNRLTERVEDDIATRVGDGIRPNKDTEILPTAEMSLPTTRPTVTSVPEVSAGVSTAKALPAERTHIQAPRESSHRKEALRSMGSTQSLTKQSYTLGVVLTALLLGTCLGLAVGLFLARVIGI